jgi:hypothetical protein
MLKINDMHDSLLFASLGSFKNKIALISKEYISHIRVSSTPFDMLFYQLDFYLIFTNRGSPRGPEVLY